MKIILDADVKKSSDILSELAILEEEAEEIKPVKSLADLRSQSMPKDELESVNEDDEPSVDSDTWLATVSSFKTEKPRGGSKNNYDLFSFTEGKKKKKKKKKDEIKDYNKEFEAELNLARNMLSDQVRFTDSLQKRYDALEASRSSARGVGKFTTDLISQINQARSVSMSIINNMASMKKTIADLNSKERKEHAATMDSTNLGNFSSQFLKQLINERHGDMSIYGDDAPVYGDERTMFDALDDKFMELEDDDDFIGRNEETSLMIKYENRMPELVLFVDRDTREYEYGCIARDTDEILYDYPLPDTKIQEINESTGIASDEYHEKYRIIWR